MNILLIHTGWMLPWIREWTISFKEYGYSPFYLTPFTPEVKNKFLLDGSKVYNDPKFPFPDLSEFDNILDDNDIDIIIFNGCFSSQERCMYSHIKSRNLLITKNQLNKKPLDALIVEMGFIRHFNYQCDTVGSCAENSYVYDKNRIIKPLTEIEKEQWKSFIKKFKDFKSKDIKLYNRKEICSNLNIDKNKQLIFCPLQLPFDALLLYQTKWCHGMAEYINACCYLFDDLEKFHIIFKQHPIYNIRKDDFIEWTIKNNSQKNVTFLPQDYEINTFSFINNCEAIATVNSSTGMEALIIDKPVIALGRNGWTPVTGIWNSSKKGTYDNFISDFNKVDTKEKRTAYLYRLMFENSITFEDKWNFNKIIEYMNQKLTYYKL